MAEFGVTVKIEDHDRGWDRLLHELQRLKGGAYAKVGVMGGVKDLHDGDPIGAAALALIHEFGAPDANVPERSFMRATCDLKGPTEWNELREKLVGLIYDRKMTIEQALGLMGARAAADMKAFVTEGDEIPPPAAPATFLRKLQKNSRGFNSTGAPPRNLIDTSRMIGSLGWQVIVGDTSSGEGDADHE
jgi:hypothetical protein